jgi:hypothetical protein
LIPLSLLQLHALVASSASLFFIGFAIRGGFAMDSSCSIASDAKKADAHQEQPEMHWGK